MAGESSISFEIHSAEEDVMGVETLTVEWLTAIDRMASEQLSVDGEQLYRGVNALKVKQVAEQATEIDDAFDAADTNGDGLLDSSEISVLLSALGEKATDEAVRTLTDAIAGEDGTIGRPEFKQWMVTNSAEALSNVRSYLLLCRQRWKIKGHTRKRIQEEAETLQMLHMQAASPLEGGSPLYAPNVSPMAGGVGGGAVMMMPEVVSSTLEQLTTKLSALEQSHKDTTMQILEGLKSLDDKIQANEQTRARDYDLSRIEAEKMA